MGRCCPGRFAPHRCLPVLQRLGNAASSSQAVPVATATTQRRLTSLHSPIASCSYHTARSTQCRSALLSRNTGIAGPSNFSSLTLARFSTALSGSVFPSQTSTPSPLHQRQAQIDILRCAFHLSCVENLRAVAGILGQGVACDLVT